MPRNANRSVPLSWVFVLTLFLLISGVGIYFVRTFFSDPYREVPELPISQYVDNSLSFRGNTYKVTGKIEYELGWSDKAGRFFSLEAETDTKSFHIAFLLPTELNKVNVQKGQNFEVKVKVVDKGLLQALQIRKV